MNIQEQMNDIIKASIITAMEKNSGEFVRQFVNDVMSMNVGGPYNSEKLIDRTVRKELESIIQDVIREQMQERREELRQLVRDRLNTRFMKQLEESLTVAIAQRGFRIAVDVYSQDDPE